MYFCSLNNRDIRSGDLIAWTKSNGFFNNIIRLFTLSEYTHVGIAVVEDDGVYVVEAIRPRTAKSRLDVKVPFYHIPMGVDFSTDDYNLLHEYIGKRYSTLQAALSWINVHIDDDKWYCTELAYDFYSKLGLHFNKKLTPTKFIKQAITKYQKRLTYIESLS